MTQPPDAMREIAIRLQTLRISHGWTVLETLNILRKQLDAGKRKGKRRNRAREYSRDARRYQKLVADGICVRCRETQADAGVRCKACQGVENGKSRQRHQRLRLGLQDRRYRCSVCKREGHTRTTCPVAKVEAA